ncbi:hypothetical protein G6F21_014713 [Rhizopus arrhizus]|nr:hypothetical protein G6F21_014713 [Rhizopus arrhizus]KAG0896712.1 hypothetical protein G6F32_017386 [Rhizopus arrhizus]KAG0923114.1 hypothetical protein G6F31_019645 [Rhizopus arrhizus]
MGPGGRHQVRRINRNHAGRRQAGLGRVPCARRATPCQDRRRQAAGAGASGHRLFQRGRGGRATDRRRAVPG